MNEIELEGIIAVCDCWPESALRAAPDYAVRQKNHDPLCPAFELLMPKLGWWSLSGDDLMRAMERAAAGEAPDMIYAEMYANSSVEKP